MRSMTYLEVRMPVTDSTCVPCSQTSFGTSMTIGTLARGVATLPLIAPGSWRSEPEAEDKTCSVTIAVASASSLGTAIVVMLELPILY